MELVFEQIKKREVNLIFNNKKRKKINLSNSKLKAKSDEFEDHEKLQSIFKLQSAERYQQNELNLIYEKNSNSSLDVNLKLYSTDSVKTFSSTAVNTVDTISISRLNYIGRDIEPITSTANVIFSNSHLNNYWALLALILVIGTAAGNILVCLAIAWERRLQNVTNYFLMSLAITDLMVAVLVMPLGILTLVKGKSNFSLLYYVHIMNYSLLYYYIEHSFLLF